MQCAMTFLALEVMAPQLMWMDGRCYRVNPTVNTDNENLPPIEPYIENGSKANLNTVFLTLTKPSQSFRFVW